MLPEDAIPKQFLSFNTPIGWLVVEGDAFGIASVRFEEENLGRSEEVSECLEEAEVQLKAYFEGQLQTFDLKLKPIGTVFQKEVWTALQAIPFGVTRSYLDIALALKNKNATRAVGAANGKNPIAVVVPCHRVIGSDGSMTGYASGVWRKEWLLKFEREQVYGKQESLF